MENPIKIMYHRVIDMARKLPVLPLDAVQNDGNTRAVEIVLLENGEPWNVPEGITAAVAFRKPDRTKGLYDRLPDGSAAVTVSGNTVTAVLAPQVLSCAGEVSAAVVFHDADLNQLATFPFALRVAANPAAGQTVSNDYYQYSTMEEVSAAVVTALASLEESKQDFLTKAEEALAVVHDTATEDAPAIVCEASGQVITAADAADRLLHGLTLYGKTTQDGTPSPENPVPLESVGEGGAITVTVGQTELTVSTPGGLPGIPVTSGGSYTDETGQAWVCDEVDLARGVYVRRLDTKVFDGSDDEPWIYGNSYIGYPDNKTLYARIWTPLRNVGFAPWAAVICDKLVNYSARGVDHVPTNGAELWTNLTNFHIVPGKDYLDSENSIETMRKWLADNPITVLYELETPIETPLSAEELAQFAALHSNYPNTTAFNDSGAGMKLAYVADTKLYIDQKLAAISAAILG